MSQLGVCWSFLDIYSIKNEKDQINTTETKKSKNQAKSYLTTKYAEQNYQAHTGPAHEQKYIASNVTFDSPNSL